MGAIASKKASWSSPPTRRMSSASAGEVSGPVATMARPHSAGGSPATSSRTMRHQRLRRQRLGDRGREAVPVDRQRPARRQLVAVAHRHDQRAQPAHLLVQQADRVAHRVVGAERVRADQLGQPVGLVRLGRRAPGRISCSTTGTPRRASCQAASLPARPPPMTWTEGIEMIGPVERCGRCVAGVGARRQRAGLTAPAVPIR